MTKVKNAIDGNATTSAPYGNTAIHLACRGLQRKVVEKLLLAKVDPCIQNQSQNDTPLHILVKVDGQDEHLMRAKGTQERIEDLIQLILPFSEESLQKLDADKKRPKDYIQSESINRIFREHFDSEADSGSEYASNDTMQGNVHI